MVQDLTKLIADPVKNNEALKLELNDVLQYGTLSERQESLAVLNDFLAAKAADIEKTNPELYELLQGTWVLLAFESFVGLESIDQDNLLKSSLLNAVERGFDVSKIIESFFNLYESDEFTKSNFRNFAKALEQNTEQFGNAPILVDGKKMMPTLKYWILDYSKFPSRVAKRSSVERLNYVNQSQNARSLTQVYKQQLLKILKLYDDFINAERPINRKKPSEEDFMPTPVAVATAPIAAAKPTMDFVPPVMQAVKPKVDIQKKLDELKDRRQNAS